MVEPTQYKCCLCGKTKIGYGNNPQPLMRTGKACDDCNASEIIPLRIFIQANSDAPKVRLSDFQRLNARLAKSWKESKLEEDD